MHSQNQNYKESSSKKVGTSQVVNTKKLMKRIKALNALFDNDDHHDSHEFMIWLLNHLHDEILSWTPKDGNPNK